MVDHLLEFARLMGIFPINREKHLSYEVLESTRRRLVWIDNWDTTDSKLVPLRKSHPRGYGNFTYEPSYKSAVENGAEVLEISTGDHEALLVAHDIFLR